LSDKGFAINKIQVKNYQASVKILFEEWRKALSYLEYDVSAVDKAELDKAQEIIKNQNEFIGKKAVEQDRKIKEFKERLENIEKLLGRIDFSKLDNSQNSTDGSKNISEHNSNEGENVE